jgi:hypothetical protein
MPGPRHASESPSQLERERWLRARSAAQTVRGAFPGVELVCVDLEFEDATAPHPGAQSHALHPPAPAFFEFPCPHADCDGGFDLSSAAVSLLTGSATRASGRLECRGTRPSAGMTKLPCGVRVRYTIVAQYHRGGGAEKK